MLSLNIVAVTDFTLLALGYHFRQLHQADAAAVYSPGFHQALAKLGHELVFASELDPELREIYIDNFRVKSEVVSGDIREIKPSAIPLHQLYVASPYFTYFVFHTHQLPESFNRYSCGRLFGVICITCKSYQDSDINKQTCCRHDARLPYVDDNTARHPS